MIVGKASAVIFGVLMLIAGYSIEKRPSETQAEIVASWLPAAAIRNALSSLEDVDRNDQLSTSHLAKPIVETAVNLGLPQVIGRSSSIRSVFMPIHIDQMLLVKSSDNRYFVSTFRWNDDPIVGACVDDPQPCTKFEWPHEVSRQEALDLLPQAAPYSPGLAQKLFGGGAQTSDDHLPRSNQ